MGIKLESGSYLEHLLLADWDPDVCGEFSMDVICIQYVTNYSIL